MLALRPSLPRLRDAALRLAAAAAGCALAAAAPEPPAAARAIDPSGEWRGARWGMTVDEVVAALPGEARRLDPPLRLADGAEIAAGVDREEIAGQAFIVRFVFEAGRLARVSLRTPADRYVGAEVYERVASEVARAAAAPGDATRDDELVDLRQTRWLLPRGTVDVKYVPGVVVVLYHRGASGP